MRKTNNRPVVFEIRNKVGIITLNRPEARNAINGAVSKGIEAAIDRIEEDDDIWVGILTATPPVFSAGGDLRDVESGKGAEIFTEKGGFGGFVQRQRNKVIIAAVEGAALGGGAELAFSCDLIVASASATFSLPEVKRGVIATGGGLFKLIQKMPYHLAMEAIVTGDSISPQQAYTFGLINRLCNAGDALNTALDLAYKICANAPIAVQESRRIVERAATVFNDAGWDLTRRASDVVFSTVDFKEGIQSFLEKRPPVWVGK